MSKAARKKPRFDLISIGDATIDTFLMIDDISVRRSAGRLEAIIPWGEKLPVREFYRTVAGNAANNAVGASRLGLKTAFYTVLAHDTGGREILHKMRKEKVATDYIVIDDKSRTNASTVLSHDGERTIFVYHEHRNYRLPDLAPSAWIYLTSLGQGFERLYPALSKYIRAHDVQVGFNPGTFQLRAGPEANRQMLKLTTILFVNKEEAQEWVGVDDDMVVLGQKLQALGPETVVITDGRRGAFSISPDGHYYISEFPGPRIEATGAGDSFATAYLAARQLGLPHYEALRYGPVNAGSVVREVGPMRGLLTQAEIEKRLRLHKHWLPVTIIDDASRDEVARQIAKAPKD